MKKPFVFLINFGYWLLYSLLLAVVFAAVTLQLQKTPGIYTLFSLLILCLAPNLVSFYSSYFFLFPKFLARRKILALVNFGSVICLISALSGILLSTVFFGFEQPVLSNAQEFIGFTISLSLIAAVHAGTALVIRGFISWYAEIKLKEELARKNYEMELALIKSQINPHFLFNTINNIDVLISKNAELASRYLNKLSCILRYMVYEAKTEKILLAKELEYIEKYIELQKIRAANPDYVNFQIAGELNNLTIAPMILFPFIENAFKHTENRKNSSVILVKVSIVKDKLVFECENSYQKSQAKEKDFGGVGNELIKKRLLLIYPEKHNLEIADSGKVYKVKLTIDLVEDRLRKLDEN
jgi:sensor histidine kinase YesM